MSIPPLLDELLRAPGAPGCEDSVQAIVRREAAVIGADVKRTVFGATIATIAGTGGRGRRVALVAHADQVGMAVRGAGEDGLLTVAKLSNWSARDTWRQRVRIQTRAGEIIGVACGVPSDAPLTWEEVRIDIGATDRDEALAMVRTGDPIVLSGPPEWLPNGRIMSAALDDRAGIYACLEALRRLARDRPAWDVAVIISTQEESGPYPGATTAVNIVNPEVAVIVEVSYAGDAPGQTPWGDVRLGYGPVIARAPILSPIAVDGLVAVADAESLPISFEAGQETWSDADGMALAGSGVVTAMVSIPLRYMHSAGEIAQLSDIEATSKLVEAYVRSLDADMSFLR